MVRVPVGVCGHGVRIYVGIVGCGPFLWECVDVAYTFCCGGWEWPGYLFEWVGKVRVFVKMRGHGKVLSWSGF